jgi:hypothetical protein
MRSGRRIRYALLAVAVVALGTAGLIRRSHLRDESAAARTARQELRTRIDRTRHTTSEVTAAAVRVEQDVAALDGELAGVRRAADDLAGQIRAAQEERDTAALNAWLTGTQINALRECLRGVNRALNQASVGDDRAASSLAAVRSSCEAAGA